MSGYHTNGLDSYAVSSMTGVETLALDTNLANGKSPQCAKTTFSVLRDWVFGGTASGTGTASSGAVTLNAARGKVTTEALTTAAAASYTLTITNSAIAATDHCFVSVANGTNNQGITCVSKVTPAAGSLVIIVTNLHASQALNGTLVISYMAVKA